MYCDFITPTKMNKMRGFIQISLLIALLIGATAVGSVGYVSLSQYLESKEREQGLESRIEQLEKQVEQTASSTETSSESSDVENETTTKGTQQEKKSQPITVQHRQVSSPVPVVTPTIPAVVTKQPEDFRATCNVSKMLLKQDQLVDVELEISFDRRSNYEIVWSRDSDYPTGNPYEVKYRFGTLGNQNISATVTRKSDGYSKQIKCPPITVECSEYSCLSLKEKQIVSLKNILDEIDSWYEGGYASLGPVNNCLISESIIRGFIYEYETVLGGKGIPKFSAEEDCSNSVAPRAYQAKIQLLINNL